MLFKGKIQRLFAYKDTSGWCSGIFDGDDGSSTKFAGIIFGAKEGSIVEMEGEIVVQPKYGEQIQVQSAKILQPVSEDGIIKALQLYDGIGAGIAKRIYKIFGKDSLKIIKTDPDKLIEVPGISSKKIEKIKEFDDINDIQSQLLEKIPALTPNQAFKIATLYGKDAVDTIFKDPYILTRDFKGIGFKIADKIARDTGISLTSKKRIRAALIYILHEQHEKNGHMYLTAQTIQAEILKLVSDFSFMKFDNPRMQNKFEKLMTEDIEKYIKDRNSYNEEFNFTEFELQFINEWVDIVEICMNSLASILDKATEDEEIFIDENFNIYYKVDYDTEYYTANVLGILSQLTTVKKIDHFEIEEKIKEEEERSGVTFGEEQKDAIITSIKSRFSIITGGPGRGKTTIINTIINIWDDDSSVILCAPTGRAAQRMKEQTGHDASTIHSLIYHNSHKSFDKCLFIVDESSMIDVSLASKFIHFVMQGNNNLILVGDADQLPSVGAGNFFNDLILSGEIPTTVLKTGYRNFGNIAENAFRINNGASFSKLQFGEDFTFVECDHEPLQEMVVEHYGKLLEKYSPREICILSPMRQRTSSGTEKLNQLIRNKYNKNVSDKKYRDFKFVPEDRVMCIKNNSQKEVLLNGSLIKGVYNGDCGIVKEIDFDENLTIIEFDDGRIGEFNNSELLNFVLSYAITIHKSQGSEYKAVVLAFTTEHFIMLQRNLLYTAITRAKDVVDIFGMKKAISIAVRNTDYKLRNSKLRSIMLAMINSIKKMPKKEVEGLLNVFEKQYQETFAKKKTMHYYDDED